MQHMYLDKDKIAAAHTAKQITAKEKEKLLMKVNSCKEIRKRSQAKVTQTR